jgi:hypothetical protein
MQTDTNSHMSNEQDQRVMLVEHDPLTYEQTQKVWVNHPSTRSKGSVHDEHEPLNDEQTKNSGTYQSHEVP